MSDAYTPHPTQGAPAPRGRRSVAGRHLSPPAVDSTVTAYPAGPGHGPAMGWLHCTLGIIPMMSRNILERCGIFIADFPPHPTAATLAPLLPTLRPWCGRSRTGRQSPPAGARDSGWAAFCLHWLRDYTEKDMKPVVTGVTHCAPCPLRPFSRENKYLVTSLPEPGRTGYLVWSVVLPLT